MMLIFSCLWGKPTFLRKKIGIYSIVLKNVVHLSHFFDWWKSGE